MRLVQCLTIIRVGTPPHCTTTPEFHFHKPIRIRERLPRHANDISLSVVQNFLRLLKR